MSHQKPPHLRQGNANPGPSSAVEVVSSGALDAPTPPPPAHLDTNAQFVWDEVWKAGGGFYEARTDSATIERYASLQSRRLSIMASIEKEGWLSVGSQGQEVLHPLARVLNEIEGKLVALEDRLGLSPQARMNLGITAATARSKLDDFIQGA